jgi:hypothetical protein
MKVRGSFIVKCDSEKAFEVLVGALGELKAKMDEIDTLRYKIDGSSRTTLLRQSTKFHARVIKHFADTVVEIYDIGLVTNDIFIKKLYNTFTKYQAVSPLEVEFFVKQIYDFKSEVDEYLDNTPMPSGGAPLINAAPQTS